MSVERLLPGESEGMPRPHTYAAVAVKYAAIGLEQGHMGSGVWHKAVAAVLARNRYTGLGLRGEGADSY